MITDVATSEDLKRSALDLLVMAWETALDTFRKLERSQIEDWDTDGSARADYDAARQPALRHAHVWVHQAQELGLKARIAEVSPYILLVGDPRTWPRPGRDGIVSFSDFRTIDAADLIRVHDTVCPTRLPADFVRRFDEGRRSRNRIVHLGGHGIAADARELLLRILDTAQVLFSERLWMSYRMESALSDVDSIVVGQGVEWGLVADFALLIGILTPAVLRRHFGYSTRRRSYVCLNCSTDERDYQEPSRFAQLVSNKGNQLFCPVCTDTHTVLREACSKPGCRSDVLWAKDYKVGTCLICTNCDEPKFRAAYDRYFEEDRI
jgi:hypothetical protein